MIQHLKLRYNRQIVFVSFFTIAFSSSAQEITTISLNKAIEAGLKNSKVLALSKAKIEQAVTKYEQAKDMALPSGSASYIYNHAEIPTSTFQLTPEADPFHLPKRADAYIGTLSLEEVIFGGNRLRYAKESTNLLAQTARLDAEKDKEDIVCTIIQAYYNLYKIQQSEKVIQRNLKAIDQQIEQAQRFFEEGIITKNEVLRFQLQKSNIRLSEIDLETNRNISVYNFNILLGLPEDKDLAVNEPSTATKPLPLKAYTETALSARKELQILDLRSRTADLNIRSIRAETLPTAALTASSYYINPSGRFIPPANQFIAPISLGVAISWNFDQLWMNKNKTAEAKIEKSQADISKTIARDNIKTEVNSSYQNYLKASDRIKILETAIVQAEENDRIMESKFQNNMATATDRLDAQVQLYQALINLELAKADAGMAYYTLLKSTGKITE